MSYLSFKRIACTLLILFNLLFTPTISFGQNLNSQAGDEQALKDLYLATDGANWFDNRGWDAQGNNTLAVGDYNVAPIGVRVEQINGELRVTGVDMQKITYNSSGLTTGNNLTGTLPESIGNLSELSDRFNVKQNFLTGTIPQSIGNWKKLKRLSLAGQGCELDLTRQAQWYEGRHKPCKDSSGKGFQHTNEFSGLIPASIGNMTELELLEIRAQRLTGKLPSEIGNLPNIKAILLNDQFGSNSSNLPIEERVLGGPLPASWGQLSTLEVLYMGSYNGDGRFTGEVPPEWENMSSITHISFAKHDLTGPIPEFPYAENKRYVSFPWNDFTGGFPTSYYNGYSPYLDLFDIQGNNLSGRLPETIPPLVKPRPDSGHNYRSAGFKISYNNFEGPLPNWVREMSVVLFGVTNNNFTGSFLKERAESNRTILLYISGNNFSGELPDIVMGNDLTQVQISGNNFTGGFSDVWGTHYDNNKDSNGNYTGKIYQFYANANELEGQIGEWLANMDLSRVRLEDNKFVFKDLMTTHDHYKNSNPSEYTIAPQKPFGEVKTTVLKNGETFLFDYSHKIHQNDEIQWTKNGEPIPGAHSPILEITSLTKGDEGEYRLELRNSGIPELGTLVSEPIKVEVTDSEDGSGDTSDKPAAPAIISPVNGAESVPNHMTFEWGQIEADEYILHVTRVNEEGVHEEFFYSDIEEVEIVETTYTVQIDTKPETVHSWRVRGVKDGVLGEWSSIANFTTQKEDGGSGNNGKGPQKSTPAKGDDKVSKKPTFKWNKVEEAETYELEVMDAETRELLIDEIVADTSYTPGKEFQPNHKYQWRVRVITNGELGDWGDTWDFTTTDEEIAFEVELNQNYPNPFNPSTNIRFRIAEQQEVSLKVYDMAGRLVASLIDGSTLSAGTHSASFNAQSLASGIYFYRLITPSEIVTRKMTLMK